MKVLSQYPQSCVRAVRRPTGADRGAVLNTGTLTIASPAGGTPIVIPYKPKMGRYQGGVPLVGWSPDGRYVATRLGNLWTSVGASAGKLFATPAIGTWTWSPAGDCALAVTATATSRAPGRSRWALRVGPPART